MSWPRPLRSAQMIAFGVLLLASAAIREGPSLAVNQAIVWLPTGVAVAGLWLFGLRAAWVVAAVTLVQRFLLRYEPGVALPAAAGSTLEAVLGVLVLRRLGFRASCSRLRDVMAVLAAAAIAPLGSIFFSWIGRSISWPQPDMPFYSGWDGWWRMNALGVITVVPLVLTWSAAPWRKLSGRTAAWVVAALTGIPALLVGAMSIVPPGSTGVLSLNLALALVLYAAVRFGMRGATLASVLAALTVAVATTYGVGPFLALPLEQRHVALQLFELTFVAIPPMFGALIAERRAAQDRGARSDELRRSIQAALPDVLFRIHSDGTCLDVSVPPGADPIVRPSDWIGRPILELLPPGKSEEFRRTIARAFASGEVATLEYEVDVEGRRRHREARCVPRGRDEIVAVVRDVTERRELEEQLRQSQKMEAVGKLAGGVAHDFNNLLTVIIGYAETIRAERATPPLVRAQVGEVLEAANRASGLTRQLLAYSRQQMLAPRVMDLAVVVGEMGAMLRRLIGEDVRLAVEPAPAPCWVRVDRSQIEQVLLNLAVNSRDAMPSGGTLTITTSASDACPLPDAVRLDGLTGPCVMLDVRDSGHGMSSEVCARAFDPFFTTKAPGKGTGLGLSTVYGIVKQSGGAVWLESEPGAGTRVRICLPRLAQPAREEAAAPPAPVASRDATVLVVEDEPSVRELVCQALASGGYRVLEASDGLAALEVARTPGNVLDLVVTDVVMPRMGGRELASRLRSERPGVPFLFLSGYPEDAREPRDLAETPGEFLAKPFTPPQLLDRVRRLLGATAARK